jgi:pyridinium-3,5-biscarboxylic acid mononucleotide sulfurtransferase
MADVDRSAPARRDELLLLTRLADLQLQIRRHQSMLVAFSGGADSALLLAAAARALGGERVVAATAWSPSLPEAERRAAAAFCVSLGVRHVTPQTHELTREGYRANSGARCGHCKAELLDTLTPLAEELGLAVVATGTNADDAVAGFRPGIAAAAARGAVTPLLDAGLTKAQVREASRRWGLSTWDKPAAACLSSRIAYGVPVDHEGLQRVERAELRLREALAESGIDVRDLRVRDLGENRARVEVDADAVAAVSASAAAADAVRQSGFTVVEVDPRGFRSGSMNELLPDPARWR